MPTETRVCVDCGQEFTMSEEEQERFRQLMATDPRFRLPKRCLGCRMKRRAEQPVMARAVPRSAFPIERAVPKIVPERSPSRKEEVRFVLATKDFEDLVLGREVVWQGVHVILADIGFDVMRSAIDRAEVERKLAAP